MTQDPSATGRSDDPADTVSYSQMYRVVKEIVEGPSRKLLESVAESIAEAILDGFDVESVTVTVKKPEVPIKGSILSHAAVEIAAFGRATQVHHSRRHLVLHLGYLAITCEDVDPVAPGCPLPRWRRLH